jgi:Ca-activated chloride channel homolog
MIRVIALLLLAQATFSVRTDLVVVPVTVTDQRGRAVRGLERVNFRVFDEDRAQTITTFSNEVVAVSLGLVVDHSLSMRPKQAAVASGVNAFASAARPEDELFMFRFNEQVTSALYDGHPFTSNAAALVPALPVTLPAGATALYDAVIEGLRRLELARSNNRALVLISDGGDNASIRTQAAMVAAAKQTNAAIYAIGVVESTRDPRAERILTQLCLDSGGAAYFAKSPSDVGHLLTQIGTDLREQYTLSFVPSATGERKGARRVRVEVVAPALGRLAVRARTSYIPRPVP